MVNNGQSYSYLEHKFIFVGQRNFIYLHVIYVHVLRVEALIGLYMEVKSFFSLDTGTRTNKQYMVL